MGSTWCKSSPPDDASGAGITDADEDPIGTSMKTVTLTVEDVEEKGSIITLPKYPHVDTAVTAILADDDGIPRYHHLGVDGQQRVPRRHRANTNVYTPVTADEGKILRVKAEYEEDGDDKVVSPVSAGQVRRAPSPVTEVPVFNPNTANRRWTKT